MAIGKLPAEVNAGVSNLTASGDTSSTLFQKWHTHTQVVEGMWVRRWVYKDNPQYGAGVASACPAVDYTYLDVEVNEKVIEEFEQASYASGFQQIHDIDYVGNAASGWGVSGYFFTSKAGIIRKSAASTDSEDMCSNSWTIQAGKQPGDYQPALDTATNFAGQFLNGVISLCPLYCDRFKINLVQL
tara:strand:- start:930 stop:1487 length:558 start_codon:yes stop_codon:yes gene_type:complete